MKKKYIDELDEIFEDMNSYTGPKLHEDELFDRVLEFLTSHNTELISKIEGIVREETPNHFTREYRDTDSMRDRICKRCRELLQYELCLTKTKKLDENNGEGGLEITEKIE